MERRTKIKFTDFECNLLINGMNEFRNMLLAEDLPTEDVDELLIKIIDNRPRRYTYLFGYKELLMKLKIQTSLL